MSTTRLVAALGLVLGLAVSVPAQAGDRQDFLKLMKKLDGTLEFGSKPQGLPCRCNANGDLGIIVLAEDAKVTVTCAIPTFAGDELDDVDPCNDFTQLSVK